MLPWFRPFRGLGKSTYDGVNHCVSGLTHEHMNQGVGQLQGLGHFIRAR